MIIATQFQAVVDLNTVKTCVLHYLIILTKLKGVMWRYLLKKAFLRIYWINNNHVNSNDIYLRI